MYGSDVYHGFNFDEPLLNWRKIKQIAVGRDRFFRAMFTVIRVERSYARLNKKVRKGKEEQGWTREIYHPMYKELHKKNAHLMYKLCKNNGATWVKFAQFLSARPDILPRAYIDALKPLQNANRSVPFSALVPVLVEELGPSWRDHFEWVGEDPIATASIAQVHKARLKNGQEVAIKVQLPEVDELFDQDFTVFQLIGVLLDGKIPSVDVKQMIRFMLEMTAEELNFQYEYANTKRFGELNHQPRIRVPVLQHDLCKKKVMVTNWIDGKRLVDILDECYRNDDTDHIKDLLTVLQNSYMQQITEFGCFQADPHPGNFLVDAEDNVWIVDYGTIGRLTPEETINYSMLIMAMMQGNTKNLGPLMKKAGFKGLSDEIVDEMSVYAINPKKAMKAQKGRAMDEIMNEFMERFQEFHVEVPDNFLAIGRVLATLGGFFQTYKIKFQGMPGMPPMDTAKKS